MNKKIIGIILLIGFMFMPIVAADDLAPYRNQAVNIYAFAGLLLFTSWLMYLYVTKDQFILTGILAGILLILLAAMMFNSLYYDVCIADATTESFYCGVQTFEIPYIFKWALQVLFFIIGFGFILDAMMSHGEKQTYNPHLSR